MQCPTQTMQVSWSMTPCQLVKSYYVLDSWVAQEEDCNEFVANNTAMWQHSYRFNSTQSKVWQQTGYPFHYASEYSIPLDIPHSVTSCIILTISVLINIKYSLIFQEDPHQNSVWNTQHFVLWTPYTADLLQPSYGTVFSLAHYFQTLVCEMSVLPTVRNCCTHIQHERKKHFFFKYSVILIILHHKNNDNSFYTY